MCIRDRATTVFTSLNSGQFPQPLFFIAPAGMAVFSYVFMKKLVFDLVDEVWDAGDALTVRNGTDEDRIALSDIKNVNYSAYVNPPRVTLSLRHPGPFGDKVSFCAPVRLMPLSTSPICRSAASLRPRIRAA